MRAAAVACVAGTCSVLAATLPAAGAPAAESKSTRPAGDGAAVHAFLVAEYHYYRSVAQVLAAPPPQVAATAEALGQECRGALAGAPGQVSVVSTEPSKLTPRARGEQQRAFRQFGTISSEISETVDAPFATALQSLREAFRAAISRLSFSNPQIATLVRAEAEAPEQGPGLARTQVCADMHAWAGSGFRRLSAASLAFAAALEARTVRSGGAGELARYETRADRELVSQVFDAELEAALGTLIGELGHVHSTLDRALGLPETYLEQELNAPIFGHGRTAAGLSFTIRETPRRALFAPTHCALAVSVDFSNATGPAEPLVLGSGGGPVCVAGASGRNVQIGCHNGTETIVVALPPDVRRVRIRLRNGRTLTSTVVAIHAGRRVVGSVYVQAVSTPAAALTELGARGQVVVRRRLDGVAHCQRERSTRESETQPVSFALAHGTSPAGTPFTIQGTSYPFGRRGFFAVSLAGDFIGSDEGGGGILSAVMEHPFSPFFADECPPRQAVIIYGLLAPPGASVLARTATGLVALTKVPIARRWHARGPLVYGVFSTFPTELIVRRANGTTLSHESLVAKAREHAQFCEGYSEG